MEHGAPNTGKDLNAKEASPAPEIKRIKKTNPLREYVTEHINTIYAIVCLIVFILFIFALFIPLIVYW